MDIDLVRNGVMGSTRRDGRFRRVQSTVTDWCSEVEPRPRSPGEPSGLNGCGSRTLPEPALRDAPSPFASTDGHY